jgi:hypothetical protein
VSIILWVKLSDQGKKRGKEGPMRKHGEAEAVSLHPQGSSSRPQLSSDENNKQAMITPLNF